MVFFKKYLIIMAIFLLVGCASKDEIDSSYLNEGIGG